jgi:transmembrane sensor
MSEPGLEEIWKGVGANPVEATAARWLARRENADWCDADQTELDAWLAKSTAHMIAYLRFHDAWNRADRLAALRAPMRKTPSPASGKLRNNMLRLTAGLVLAAGAAALAVTSLRTTPAETTYATPVGGREIIALSDGSQVELNTDTVLQIDKANARSVTLVKGEAFFQIKHDVKHPFVVTAFGHRITDLGTKFAVRGSAQHLVVTLVEGSARVEAEKPGHESASAVLAPGDIAVATANTISVTKKPAETLSDQLAWRQGMLVFNRATLAEVAQQFNRYNSRKVIIADSATARLAIMGKFPVNDVDLFGRVAKAVLGVTITHRGGEIIVSSKPADK